MNRSHPLYIRAAVLAGAFAGCACGAFAIAAMIAAVNYALGGAPL